MSVVLRLFLFLLITQLLTSCSALKDPQKRQLKLLQKGRIKEDTSYVYWLPYAEGTYQRLVQGYFSKYTHKNRPALDFKMKPGTPIHAARNGVVIRVEESNNKGGMKKAYRQYANLIVIQHSDGSRAGYWHLQHNGAFVNTGDTIQKGQLIGLSGNTGFTAFPHLHFIVWRSGGGTWRPIGSRFITDKGILYVRPFRKYRSIHLN